MGQEDGEWRHFSCAGRRKRRAGSGSPPGACRREHEHLQAKPRLDRARLALGDRVLEAGRGRFLADKVTMHGPWWVLSGRRAGGHGGASVSKSYPPLASALPARNARNVGLRPRAPYPAADVVLRVGSGGRDAGASDQGHLVGGIDSARGRGSRTAPRPPSGTSGGRPRGSTRRCPARPGDSSPIPTRAAPRRRTARAPPCSCARACRRRAPWRSVASRSSDPPRRDQDLTRGALAGRHGPRGDVANVRHGHGGYLRARCTSPTCGQRRSTTTVFSPSGTSIRARPVVPVGSRHSTSYAPGNRLEVHVEQTVAIHLVGPAVGRHGDPLGCPDPDEYRQAGVRGGRRDREPPARQRTPARDTHTRGRGSAPGPLGRARCCSATPASRAREGHRARGRCRLRSRHRRSPSSCARHSRRDVGLPRPDTRWPCSRSSVRCRPRAEGRREPGRGDRARVEGGP